MNWGILSSALLGNSLFGLDTDQHIRVNALAPGTILTPFHERFTDQARMEAAVATIPMGRAGTPEECVGAVFFLASEVMSGYVTGQMIEVNGGQLMP